MNYPASPPCTFKGKKHTIDKLNHGQEDCSPGPIYNVSGLGAKIGHSFSAGLSKRTNINHGDPKTPGPAHYVSEGSHKLFKKSISFAQSQRVDEEKKNKNPQASRYNPTNALLKSSTPNFSLKPRPPCIMDGKSRSPGPAAYFAHSKLFSAEKNKKGKFGNGERFGRDKVHSPGPGDYDILNQNKRIKSNKGTMGTSKRMPEPKDLPPGPGQYSYRESTKSERKDALVRSRRQGCFNVKSDTTKAFNNYFRESEAKKTGKGSIPKQKRQIFKKQPCPGPSDYYPQKSRNDATHAIIPSSTYNAIQDPLLNPGPGHYVSNSSSKSKKYSLGKSKSISYFDFNAKIHPSPGPGQYESTTGIGKKSNYMNRSIGTSKRTNFTSPNLAGVGDYNIATDRMSQSLSISKANRFKDPGLSPGPGDYQIQPIIGNYMYYTKQKI